MLAGITQHLQSNMTSEMEMPGGHDVVFAFDFDGVICESVGENFITTWRALRAAGVDAASHKQHCGVFEQAAGRKRCRDPCLAAAAAA